MVKTNFQLIRTRLSVLATEGHSKVWHGPQDGNERLDGVGVDHRPVLLEVLRGEPAFVNDPAKAIKTFRKCPKIPSF